MKGLDSTSLSAIPVTPEVQRFAADSLAGLSSLSVRFSDLVEELRRDLAAVVDGSVQTTTAVQHGPRGYALRGQEQVNHWSKLSGKSEFVL
ncbi:hypothetical protein KBB08_02590 [Candidatus Gracilibacteria bacterium]|nr:hypothetical protein [Candidatus Gracilibacteria bacterium]